MIIFQQKVETFEPLLNFSSELFPFQKTKNNTQNHPLTVAPSIGTPCEVVALLVSGTA